MPLAFFSVPLLAAAGIFLALSASADPVMPPPSAPETLLTSHVRSLSGSYLAGRHAQRNQDWDEAQKYMSAVARFDRGNHVLDQRVFLLSLGAGNYAKAYDLARKIVAENSNDSELPRIYLAADALAKGEFKAARAHIDKLPEDGFGQYTKPLIGAWIMAGEGKVKAAIQLLSQYADKSDPTFNVHAALMSELGGDIKSARKYYRAAMENGLTLHSAYLAINFLKRNGDQDTAAKVQKALAEVYPLNPFVTALATMPAGQANIVHARQGAAVALFDLANLLYERRTHDSAQIYNGLVLLLDPLSPFARLLAGDLAAVTENYDKAIAHYQSIDSETPAYWLAQMRVAEVLESTEQTAAAMQLLGDLARHEATAVQAHVSLGDIHRRNKEFGLAVKSYDQALAGAGEVTPEFWSVIYARGMSLEREGDWDKAEKDLMTALKFQPDNPMILNFIGYSWLEKNIHLDRALDYTRRAAAMRPNDGYIVDSYGWALYKNGRFDDAVVWMERAASLMPEDPTILDHLGDVYWQVGRHNEARFKWLRAKENSTDDSLRQSLSAKIKSGIDSDTSKTALK